MTYTVKLDLTMTRPEAPLVERLREELSALSSTPSGAQLVLVTSEEADPLERADEGADFVLRGPEAPAELIAQLTAALSPMTLSHELAAGVEGEWALKERPLASLARLHVTSDEPTALSSLEPLAQLGFEELETELKLSPRPSLSFHQVSPSQRRRFMWAARQLQLPMSLPTSPPFSSSSLSQRAEIKLHLPSVSPRSPEEALAGVTLRLRGDDHELLSGLRRALSSPSLSVTCELISDEGEGERGLPWFELSFGLLSYHDERCKLIAQVLGEALDQAGLEGRELHECREGEWRGWTGSASELERAARRAPVTLSLPLRRARQGRLFHPDPARRSHWRALVYTDSATQAAPLITALESRGYIRPLLIEQAPSTIAVALQHPVGCPEPIIEELSALCRGLLQGSPPPLSVTMSEALTERELSISVSFGDLEPEGYQERLQALSAPHRVSLKCERVEDAQGLLGTLTSLGVEGVELSAGEGAEAGSPPRLMYGGAPWALVSHLQALIERALGAPCLVERCWGEDDLEVWVQLPSDHEAELSAAPAQALELRDWLPTAPSEPSGPLLERLEGGLRVAELRLSSPSELEPLDLARVPQREDFGGYCLDQGTSDSLWHVAEAVSLSEPCLLEGPTSASKTSVILYLAALLGQPVARLNLSAQTDTGELIGRYAPERSGWRWRDGLVIEALTRGWWLILDELNLAEPQVLERLNSLLERRPKLTVSERDGRLLGGPEAPIHPRFRVFATMNPTEYVGRAPLSPAYRDRWLADRVVPEVTERALFEMIALWLWGGTPEVSVLGRRYEGALSEVSTQEGAVRLAEEAERLRPLALGLARLHCGLSRLSAQRLTEGELTQSAQVTISRRSLLATLSYLRPALEGAGGLDELLLAERLKRAIWRYYIARLRTSEQRGSALALWRSSGLAQLGAQ